jgi:hypothetical protein
MEEIFFILTQIPLSSNTRSSIRQCSVSTLTLHANQILQNSREDVAVDKTTWYVPLATKVILFWKYIYLILFLFLSHVVVHLCSPPNVISLSRNLPNKIS